ncbi:mannose-1-phosphate guanylyltransferase/mannose-6-phosphate isomerase [Rahnella aceris]|uniref:mannose-1-phosphate guanylyltransferase/mannose-6-phosphate isomerase n=1 Tax=Rahnella sp. (strain Y9602) TaxID=2703885 RepID=UPI001F20AD57|nr:mannose-1-phosphate guanylyltransferase/mannose-6-phosphate isomerase [Rahnella aceris]
MRPDILPVIMAGGAGTRLWPLSRTHFPKQFLSLTSDNTLFQDTLIRVSDESYKAPIVVCNHEHRFLVAEQLRKKSFPHTAIILEPLAKNTAPAIALAALKAMEGGTDPILLVLAADHYIDNISEFNRTVTSALPLVEKGKMVTFGVCPTSAETGYGYIKSGDAIDNAFGVASFVEKPARDLAESYLSEGGYFWNSGIFLFKASQYLAELKEFCPEVLNACINAINNSHQDLDFIRLDSHLFSASPNISIDYAVMERTKNAVVMPLDIKWNDVGSWSALWEIGDKDQCGNVIRGDVLIENTNNSYINASSKLVATVGLNDIIIVETRDAVLVANKLQVQEVKSIVNKLQQNERQEALHHKEVFRPWGFYDHISEGSRYQIKKVYLKPGQRISTQMHYHRTEHWVVVSGTAKVYKGNDVFVMGENESTYIPVGVAHSLENPGLIPLELIEIHSGLHLSEDDVVRLDKNTVAE